MVSRIICASFFDLKNIDVFKTRQKIPTFLEECLLTAPKTLSRKTVYICSSRLANDNVFLYRMSKA